MRDVEISFSVLQLRALLDRKDRSATYVVNENGFEPLRVTITVAEFKQPDPSQQSLFRGKRS